MRHKIRGFDIFHNELSRYRTASRRIVAKQAINQTTVKKAGLLRRFAPRNDEIIGTIRWKI
jgi:hypothetical protein